MTHSRITPLEKAGPLGFKQFRVQVPPEFEDIFSNFYFASNDSSEPITKTLLPSFQTMVAFHFGEQIQLLTGQPSVPEVADKKTNQKNTAQLIMGKYAILGPIKKAFSYTLYPGAELLTLNFKQDAFFRFFGQTPAASETPVNPDLLIGQGCFGEWWQTLSQMKILQERVDYLLAVCRPYIRSQDKRIAEAVQLKQKISDVTVDPIKNIAAVTRQSIRNVQLQFKKQLGYSAKAYLRNQRFMQAILLIQATLEKDEKLDWFTIIEACHYYDQSQLIKDFQYFMALTPTEYLQFQREICHSQHELP